MIPVEFSLYFGKVKILTSLNNDACAKNIRGIFLENVLKTKYGIQFQILISNNILTVKKWVIGEKTITEWCLYGQYC